MRTLLLRSLPVLLTLGVVSSASALGLTAMPEIPTGCTLDVKLCPDGSSVRRQKPYCTFAECPPQVESCSPHVCANGKTHPRCSEDGHVINYFAAPCHMDGGEEGAPFSDVSSDHENADAIFYVKSQGIVQGYEDGTFKPDQTINRAEFVKFIIATKWLEYEMTYDEYAKINTLDSDCFERHSEQNPQGFFAFSDVVQGIWYQLPLCTAYGRDWIDGYPDGTFRPSTSINFVEAAKILSNMFELEASTTIPGCEVSGPVKCPWYRSYVLMLEMKNAIPTSITRFDQNITRGEMAEMIYRLKTGVSHGQNRSYEDIARGSKTFNGCGKVASYANHAWFADFSTQAKENGFDLDTAQFSEGCLALDGSLFMAIYSGGYCGGSTFLLYKPFERNLDTAGIQWKSEGSCEHNINEFGMREGSVIKLKGSWGDAGCWAYFYYDYDLVSNTIVKTAMETQCEGEPKAQWTYYE